jgi:ketopantoate reductase
METLIKAPVVIIGIGEMGGVFARGYLRAGHPVYPVTRKTNIEQLAQTLDKPEVVVIAVGEAELQPSLEKLPQAWRDRLLLLQNELLPGDYAELPDPTVISVWFEKKPGQDAKVIIPSPAHGPRAAALEEALGSINIPVRVLKSAEEMEFELVVKNLYILTTNIAGLKTGGTVGELWADHRELARSVGNDVIDIQEALTGNSYDREALFAAMVTAFEGDPEHKCMGRSAPARLKRALAHAETHKLSVPALKQIAEETDNG